MSKNNQNEGKKRTHSIGAAKPQKIIVRKTG